MAGVNFNNFKEFFKTDYIPKILDTLLPSERLFNHIKRLPITEKIVGNKAQIPFDLRRISSISHTFSDSQDLSDLAPAADLDQAWELEVADIYSTVRISEKAYRAGLNKEGAIFKILTNAGNKALAGIRYKVLSALFADIPGTSGKVVAAVSSGKSFQLVDAHHMSNFEKGDQIEFRDAAGMKKGSGYAVVDKINLNGTNIAIVCEEDLPALAKDDIVWHRGAYGKTYLSGLNQWYPKNPTAGDFMGVSRGSDRNSLADRRLLGLYWEMSATDKFYDVIQDACANISSLTKGYPTMAVMHPLTYKVVLSDLRENQRTSGVDAPDSYPGLVSCQACPLNRIYLLDENCIGFHFLPANTEKAFDKESITPQDRWRWTEGVEKFSKEGLNLVDFDYTPNGDFIHIAPKTADREIRCSFHGNFLIKAPGTGAVIELDSSKVPQFKT